MCLVFSWKARTCKCEMAAARNFLFSSTTPRFRPFSNTLPFHDELFRFSLSPRWHQSREHSISAVSSSPTKATTVMDSVPYPEPPRWKPMCLYHTQGKCTMTNDTQHLEKFNHDISVDLKVNDGTKLRSPCSPDFGRLLVLDLEGKVEILEFPVLMIDANTMSFVDSFHRFVRPVRMSEKRVNEYIDGKYGKLGIDRVWHDTAIPFKEVLHEFENWLASHNLWNRESGGALNQAAFVTCGNWDLKTKIPQQCSDSCIKLPSYFMEWINLKDIFLNFYNIRAPGMMSMIRELEIPLLGSHHLGIDDTKNITRVLQRMISDGSPLQITARRSSASSSVKFFLENRIR